MKQLGQEPDPSKMPLNPSDFPEEVQVAFFMFSLSPGTLGRNERNIHGKVLGWNRILF